MNSNLQNENSTKQSAQNTVIMTHGKNVQIWTNPFLTNEPKIVLDSFCVRILRDTIDYVSPKLMAGVYTTKQTVSEDGEVFEEEAFYKDTNDVSIVNTGYGFGFKHLRVATIDGKKKCAGQSRYYIDITVSSKLLEENYLKGISFCTLDTIIKRINDTGEIKLTKEAFLQGTLSDVDFKIDNQIHKDEITPFLKGAYDVLKPEYKKVKGLATLRTKKTEQALYIGDRGSKTNKGLGFFFKFYSKGHELQYHAKPPFHAGQFNDAFIHSNINNDVQLLRTEISMRGKDEALSWGLLQSRSQRLTAKKLFDIIDIDQNKLMTIFAEQFDRYFIQPIEAAESAESKTKVCKLSMKDRDIIYNSAKHFYSIGTPISAIQYMAEQFSGGVERKLKEAMKIVDEAIKDVEELKEFERLQKERKAAVSSSIFMQLDWYRDHVSGKTAAEKIA